jgi:GTP cyclohydrolase I
VTRNRLTHVIVGTSPAGAKAAETLRADGSDARFSPRVLAIVADPTAPAIDRNAAQCAVRDLLAALGQDTDDAELVDTPRRVVAAFEELLTPAPFAMTTFANDEGYDELVIARDIPIRSVCAHHLLPFTGVAHVAYLPDQRILGLSKLARATEMFSRGLQIQERLTTQIGAWLNEQLRPKGVGVVIEAEHLCMTMRGVRARGSRTVTSSLHGLVRDDARTRAEFLALARR